MVLKLRTSSSNFSWHELPESLWWTSALGCSQSWIDPNRLIPSGLYQDQVYRHNTVYNFIQELLNSIPSALQANVSEMLNRVFDSLRERYILWIHNRALWLIFSIFFINKIVNFSAQYASILLENVLCSSWEQNKTSARLKFHNVLSNWWKEGSAFRLRQCLHCSNSTESNRTANKFDSQCYQT